MDLTYSLLLASCTDPLVGLSSKLTGSVDHVITDPPYSPRVHRNLGRERRSDGGKERGALDFAALDPLQRKLVAEEFARLVKRWVIIFTDELGIKEWADDLTSAGLVYVCSGIWVKTNPMPQMNGLRPAYGAEHIVIAHAKAPTRWNGGGKPATYQYPTRGKGEKRFHPTQKPLDLIQQIVHDFTDPGDSILDPYTGSGTTGVACKKWARSFAGYEFKRQYHQLATARITEQRCVIDDPEAYRELKQRKPSKQLRLFSLK